MRIIARSTAILIALAAASAQAQVTTTGTLRPKPAQSAPVAASTEQSVGLSIEDVIALSEMQLGDEAIIAKIQAAQASFDLTTGQMIELKKRGVSGPVIAAMVRTGVADSASEMSVDSPDPNVPHPAGIYLLQGSGETARMFRIDPTSSSQMKTGGILGYALTSGIAPMSMKVSVPGATARAKASTRPSFYFFFDQAQAGASASSFLGTTYLGSSPAEFNLVRLNAKKDRREAKVGKVGLTGAKMGIMDEDRIPIDYELVRPGVYRVSATAALAPGEYGFLYSIGSAQGGAATARIFDFSVR